MEQTNTTPNPAPAPTPDPAPTPTSASTPNPIVVNVQAPPAKKGKWFESPQVQAAFITGSISTFMTLVNTLIQKIR